jgi:hypothetical protein
LKLQENRAIFYIFWTFAKTSIQVVAVVYTSFGGSVIEIVTHYCTNSIPNLVGTLFNWEAP